MIFKNKPLNISSLKTLNYEELDELAKVIRQEIIKVVSNNGGHLSSNLGIVELTLAIGHFFNLPHDKILFDVGHQSYVYKIITGRNLSSLRKKGGISGFQKRSESIYDFYEAGHSSTSLSYALGIAITKDLNKEDYHVIALIGDASLMNGLALEALNDIGTKDNKVIIILNDNNCAISPTVGAIHEEKNKKNIFNDFNIDYLGPINGHNIKELEDAFKKAINNKKSIVLHVYTQKGKGYKFAEVDKVGRYHIISPFDINTGEMINNNKDLLSYQSYFSELIDQEMQKNKKVLLISPATYYNSLLNNIFLKYKERCFDVGIEEEHALILASSMALNGFKPIISIYSTFLQRAIDQLLHDASRMKLPLLLLIDRSGLIGEDGESHQGIYEEAFLLNIPHMTLTVPSDIKTSKALFKLGINYKDGPFAIRYPKDYYLKDDKVEDIKITYGKWIKESSSNKSIGVLACGKIVAILKEELKRENIDVNLYNAIFLKPLDEDSLKDLMQNDYIIIIDTMATKNGFINLIATYLLEHHYKGEIKTYALKDEYISHATIKEQQIDNHVDACYLIGEIKYIYSKLKVKSSE